MLPQFPLVTFLVLLEDRSWECCYEQLPLGIGRVRLKTRRSCDSGGEKGGHQRYPHCEELNCDGKGMKSLRVRTQKGDEESVRLSTYFSRGRD